MLRVLFLSLLVLLLTGCVGDRSDLELFVTTTKAQHASRIVPLKQTPEFEHFFYHAELMRSPFAPSSRELTEEVIASIKDCLQPDLKRHKGRLETYALDNLKMRGTLSEAGIIWALVETNDGSVYRLGIGEYLGLYNGHIAKVNQQLIEIIELIPDGSGCWTERLSSMELSGK